MNPFFWRKKSERPVTYSLDSWVYSVDDNNLPGKTINWKSYPTVIVGWMPRKPRPGDILTSQLTMGTGVFLIVSVEYVHNPHDMFFASLRAIGYKHEIKDLVLKSVLSSPPRQPHIWEGL